ncbi:winged helix-turn-helix domain-containing protein, partial [Kribbella albertanoniae]
MDDDGLVVSVLGSVRLRFGGVEVVVARPLERALLVRLALARGAVVVDERLAADLWGAGEVQRVAERLRVVVSRLRAALG